jgi:mannose-6-phosphate isomerase-like protein (cupin superfamily)
LEEQRRENALIYWFNWLNSLRKNNWESKMAERINYNINLDVKYDHHEVIDVPKIVEECDEIWFNQTLTKVNDSVVRIGIIEGDFHWHKHDDDDEFFYVVEGKLYIDLEDKTLELNPGQGTTISKGIMHRPRAPKKVVMLMVETSEIAPTGN